MKVKNIIIVMLLLLAIMPVAFAHLEQAEIENAQQIINAQTSCSSLSDDQLEAIGDYYMELMHPGEEHELMDESLGGEGSEQLRQMHIHMAEMMYCGRQGYMMGTMMRGGMMNGWRGYPSQETMPMHGWGWYGSQESVPFLPLLFLVIIAGFIIWILLNHLKKSRR